MQTGLILFREPTNPSREAVPLQAHTFLLAQCTGHGTDVMKYILVIVLSKNQIFTVSCAAKTHV